MENYQWVRAKITNTQLNKLKAAAKTKAGRILRKNKKIFQE